MVTDKKIKDVVMFWFGHDDNETLNAFGIKQDTLRRYIHRYRELYPVQFEESNHLRDIRLHFTPAEIRAIAKSSRIRKEIKESPLLSFSGKPFKIGVISDTHIGHEKFNEPLLLSAFNEFERQNVDFIVNGGDTVEGMSGRNGHVYELTHIGFEAQVQYAIELLKKAPAPMYGINGNHDKWYTQKSDIGADVGKTIAREIETYTHLGDHEGDIEIDGARLRLWHGNDGSSYALSYRGQKIIESLSGGDKPNILVAGNVHKALYMFVRNVHYFEAGCFEDQTEFMRTKKLPAMQGFWIIEPCIDNGEVVSMGNRFYPHY